MHLERLLEDSHINFTNKIFEGKPNKFSLCVKMRYFLINELIKQKNNFTYYKFEISLLLNFEILDK